MTSRTVTAAVAAIFVCLLASAREAHADALPGPSHRDPCEVLPKDATCHLHDGREGRCTDKKCAITTPSAIAPASVSGVTPPPGPNAPPAPPPAPIKRGCAAAPDASGTSGGLLLLVVVAALGRRRSRA